LGESVIEVGEARIGPSAPNMFAALLYLALEAGRRVPRVRLQELLFPTSDERKGSHSLRQLLYRMRRLGVELEGDANSVTLPSDKVASDYQQLLKSGRIDCRNAVTLVHGLLPACESDCSRSFIEWLDHRRAELLGQIRRSLTAQLGEHRQLGDWAAVEETARALLGLDPLNEEATLGRHDLVRGRDIAAARDELRARRSRGDRQPERGCAGDCPAHGFLHNAKYQRRAGACQERRLPCAGAWRSFCDRRAAVRAELDHAARESSEPILDY
jgi:hypothetical protein